MFLRGHGYCKPLGLGGFPAIGQPLSTWTILYSLTKQPIPTHARNWLPRRQCMQRYHSHTTTAAENEAPSLEKPMTTTSLADPEIPTVLPRIRKPSPTSGQTSHDLGSKPSDQCEEELYADQVTALPPSDSESGHTKKRPHRKTYGKHKRDKRLVNQLLKDKGQLSHDWRIPLLQLERHSRSRDGNGASLSSMHGQSQRRKVTQQDPIRTVPSTTKGHSHARLAREVPQPSLWSESTFLEYITDVAQSQVSQMKIPRVLKPQTKNWSNHLDVLKIFEDTFYDPTLERFMSLEACSRALKYYYKHGLISNAWNLYDHMNALRMRISTETFNLVLRGAASKKDLHTFTALLHRMLEQGFSPDEATWINLLIAVDSMEARAIICQRMEQKGLLTSPKTRAAVAALVIPNEINFHVGNGRDPMTFFDHMDACYGKGWLTNRAGNYFLSEIGKLRPISECLELLGQMKERYFIADEVTLNTLLHKCVLSRTQRDVMKVLNFCEHEFGLRPGGLGYTSLFQRAWTKQQLNFARVIWQSACIDGSVTFKMRQLLHQNLKGDDSMKRPKTFGSDGLENRRMPDLFRQIAGEFVVGIGQTQTTKLAKPDAAPWQSEDDWRVILARRATHLINIDTLIAGRCRLKLLLPDLLQQALNLDSKWLADEVYRIETPQKLIREGIRVEVHKLETSLLEARRIQEAMEAAPSHRTPQ